MSVYSAAEVAYASVVNLTFTLLRYLCCLTQVFACWRCYMVTSHLPCASSALQLLSLWRLFAFCSALSYSVSRWYSRSWKTSVTCRMRGRSFITPQRTVDVERTDCRFAASCSIQPVRFSEAPGGFVTRQISMQCQLEAAASWSSAWFVGGWAASVRTTTLMLTDVRRALFHQESWSLWSDARVHAHYTLS